MTRSRADNYVAVAGPLLVGSSAFTRLTNGAPRGDFALASQMGVHLSNVTLQNWEAIRPSRRCGPRARVAYSWRHAVVHMPDGGGRDSLGHLTPHSPADDTSYLASPAGGCTVIAQGDTHAYLPEQHQPSSCPHQGFAWRAYDAGHW